MLTSFGGWRYLGPTFEVTRGEDSATSPPQSKAQMERPVTSTLNSRQDPRIREYQVFPGLSIGCRPLSWPVQAWCYQQRDLCFGPGDGKYDKKEIALDLGVAGHFLCPGRQTNSNNVNQLIQSSFLQPNNCAELYVTQHSASLLRCSSH